MDERKDKSPHILNTASTLLGLCFVVLTSLKIANRTAETIIDELTAFAIVLFMTSSVMSFLSMRSEKSPGARYEKIADIVFLSGLFFLFVTTMLILFNVIR